MAQEALDERRISHERPPVTWIAIKDVLVELTRLDKDALHIYAGLLIQLVASRLAPHGLADWRPVLAVLLAVLCNEAYDVLVEVWPPQDRARQWLMGVHDVANTLAVPLLIWVLARRWRAASSLSPGPS